MKRGFHWHAKQREVEKKKKWKYTWREADVPLVGCFANDTENRFTAGIDNNSEEIKKVTSYHFTVHLYRMGMVLQSWRCETVKDSRVRSVVGLGFYSDYSRIQTQKHWDRKQEEQRLVSQCDLDF